MSAKVKIYNAATILFSICGEWTGLMSGSFSVLFTAAAFHFEGHERRIFVFLAFGALWICVLRLSHHSEIQLRGFQLNPHSLPDIKDIVWIRTKPPSPANDINGKYIFHQLGEYILYVSVSGKGVPTAKAELKFTWTGKADTSTIERIK
jgi:hypothetical protein